MRSALFLSILFAFDTIARIAVAVYGLETGSHEGTTLFAIAFMVFLAMDVWELFNESLA